MKKLHKMDDEVSEILDDMDKTELDETIKYAIERLGYHVDIIVADNLYDIQKIEILRGWNNSYNLEQLQEIDKKIHTLIIK